MGLDFYRRAVSYAAQYRRPGQELAFSIQTNGILLDNAWAEFFCKNNFLVGISLDGPLTFHDAYRLGQMGQPTFERVWKGLNILKKNRVEFNVLCTVNAVNSEYPLEVYRFLRDEAGAQFIQFIPIVERQKAIDLQGGSPVSKCSVRPGQWGRFLTAVFNEWVRRDVGKIFIPIFDAALANWLGLPAGLCIFQPTCGHALALEHNGDLYPCDHFVDPQNYLGNIHHTGLGSLVKSDALEIFGRAKQDQLPRYCRDCPVRFACHGGCPKNRFIATPDGEAGLNYLCAGYRYFFQQIDLPMRYMANEFRHHRSPANVMEYLNAT